MTAGEVLDIAREGVWTMILVAGPTMVVGLIVGVVIALFQALTQIQEMTLVFVPKILAIFVTILVTLPFMSQVLESFMGRVTEMILTTGG
ncbi:MAG: flagellar biosynthesis protein FliQ [Roseibium album]|uniref:Flagellar biosynthetic protein FliQ n=1 Tax=Roseibium album TaxID=311410 RepID=A0A0M6Z9E2_9HYPH|nr:MULTISPECIES: flagellar biosynthesis protein FliQ [Stappiaceae]MBG6143153.1 flagellar biosynthetic protein FliQ [Labrenzia sp. EL_142]MBG6157109.1 flagellar biosynthetic protein FliQ [Labrenzia sp. EL_162]MBG6166442.1 flagellar biosynthetic protein FliQ [Labrenzia sp. EL_195]MBG6172359.1 flagellar biosynthetic protein FliQ [Labrenzia sp. EL_132]MBG6194949.1 flagellar biosynthetic protein FliQ [Labrenzia sp. EL_159]MBG6203470.1 flagellar biosynthetic protein FliQ [Labrenzia sp. EL_13]MBG62